MNETLKHIIFSATVLAIFGISLFVAMHYSKQGVADTVVAVHVKGEVKNPGYYELEYGKRVKDAIEVAGGTTQNAKVDELNLAMKLVDGEEIIVPSKEVPQKNEVQNKEDSSESNVSGKIDINKADVAALCEINGIGESLADEIISYRDKHGKYKSIDEIKNVRHFRTIDSA